MLKHPSAHCILRWSDQPPSGGCVLKPFAGWHGAGRVGQPPSGGCVLKLSFRRPVYSLPFQPPSGGCVLKQIILFTNGCCIAQPPSGGCVLKLGQGENHKWILTPAAFRRLCVETLKWRENVLAAVLKRSPPPVLKRCLDLPRSNSRSQQNILAKMICCFVNI